MYLIDRNIKRISKLCINYKVAKLFVFGSVLSDKFNSSSDIDLLVDFEEIDLKDYADNYFNLKQELEKIFKRPVDLLEEKAIRNPYLKEEINKERKLIYG